MSADPPGIMFEFFHEKYLPAIMVIPARPHRMHIKHEKLKINELGPNYSLAKPDPCFSLKKVWVCKTTITKHLMMS